MAVRLLSLGARKNTVRLTPFGSCGAHDTVRSIIGNRDIVGFGVNGQPEYVDRPDFPMPAVRWKETSPEIAALREKERGDWRKLTMQEKKTLYRSSFCSTYSEFNAPTGEWKSVTCGGVLIAAVGVCFFLLEQYYVFMKQELPASFSEESKRAQLRRIFDIRAEAITGLGSRWDHEKNTWKR